MEKEAIYTAYRWWQAMFLPDTELKAKGMLPAPSSQKAQLKRCQGIDAAMLSEGFRNLWLALPEKITQTAQAKDIESWATIAAALVFVTSDTKTNLAKAAGSKGDGDKSLVSEMRFAQLQNSKTPDEFLRRLRRILQQIEGTTNVQQLIQDLLLWFKERNQLRPQAAVNRIAVRWAMDYYQAAR